MIMYRAADAAPKQVGFVARQSKTPKLPVAGLTERGQPTQNF